MINLHPNILKKNGKEEFVILSFEEFIKVQEELEDFELLKKLREAKEKESMAKMISHEEVKKYILK